VAGTARGVYLIDASIYIFRAWYSVPDSLYNQDGMPINALHGFAGFLGSFLEQTEPGHVAVVFDASLTSSFRNGIYPDYKANREPPPAGLQQQFAWCRELVGHLGLAQFTSDTYEADDLIGTLAARLRRPGVPIVILSADKDLAQLLQPGDLFWDFARNRRYRHADVPDWLGVEAGQVADWLALTGDSVDNIPGIPGIGAKTAAALLAHFGTLAELYRQVEAVAELPLRGAARIQRLLQAHRDTAMLARQLTGIAVDPDMAVSMKDLGRRSVAAHAVSAACEQLGLGRMTQARLARLVG
jgi:5'-3' exonuclease